MGPVKIADDIYWVGVVDWHIRDFHGYSTYKGSTYNAYLILDEKITLIDTVKKEFTDELLDKISQIIDPKDIDIVISNHTEMDHSGALVKVLHHIGKDKPVYCSEMGYKDLKLHFSQDLNLKKVKDKEELKIGKRTLKFLETRMLHWPDSMFTYVEEDKILFSSDAFGQHYASFERFDDEVEDKKELMYEVKKYFANILMLFSPLILKLLEKINSLNLSFNMICPDHGVIWRKGIGEIIELYKMWSLQTPKNKAVIVYDTMWHSTELMAKTIGESIAEEGTQVKIMKLRSDHRSDIITEILDAGAVVVGSPTINNNLFPTIADFLTYMKGLRPKNKVAAGFGSYGWSGEAVKYITESLKDMNLRVIEPGLKIQFVPDKDGIKKCIEFGKKIAGELKELLKQS